MNRTWFGWILAFSLTLLPARAPAQEIGSILSSFTVANLTSEPADDFHVIVSGIVCGDLSETVGPTGWTFACMPLPDGNVLLGWQGGPPAWPGQSLPFGLRLVGSPQWRIVCAYWTAGGRVLFPMATWPNQRWDIWSTLWADVVDGYQPPVNPQVTIVREWTPVPSPLALADLTWDATAPLPWQPSGNPELIPNNPQSFFDIFLESNGMPALLVRYPVYAEGMEIPEARFTNQIVLGDFQPAQMFSSFDVVNRGTICANDFHVVLEGVTCATLLSGPQGLFAPPGWQALCIDLPSGTGCEIRWTAVDGSCVLPGEMRHFGYGLFGLPDFRITAAYWTWNGVPILPFLDVVQQVWLSDSPGQVVDRVWGYPPLVDPWGVYVMREWAWSPQPVPLSMLTWDETLYLPWTWADPGMMQIPPDPWIELPFFFPWLPTEVARLIRYQVWGGAEQLFMTFVNEAVPGVVEPIPPIEDLRIHYLGESEPGVGHFRLEWTPPPSPDGLPLEFRIIGYTNPYDATTEVTEGYTVESFFDVFTSIETQDRTQAPPHFWRVVADYLPLQH